MIDPILRKIDLFARTEKLFAVFSWCCAVFVFLFLLFRSGKDTTWFRRIGLMIGAVIVLVVTFYSQSVVFADDRPEDLPILWIREEEGSGITTFKNQTKVIINAQDVQLKIWICRVGEPWYEEVEVPDRDDPECDTENDPNGVFYPESLLFDVPDGSAYRFIVQACRNGYVEEAVAFSIDKTKETTPPEPDLTEKPEQPGIPSATVIPVITQSPEPTLSPEPGNLPETERSPTPEITPQPTVSQKPEMTEEPAFTLQPTPVPEPAIPYVPEETKGAATESDDLSGPSGEPEASEHTALPEEENEYENMEAEESRKREVKTAPAASPVPEGQKKKKENYTVTIRQDGSTFSTSSETMKAVENVYISEISQLTVVELNPERLESSAVSYTLNGETVLLEEGRDYSLREEKTADGWKYIYQFKEQVFEKDGFYQVNILSSDSSGKKNNNSTAGTDIHFVKDKTAPVILVTGLENGAYYPQNEHVYYLTVRDNTDLDTLMILKNGETDILYRYKDGKWINEKKEEDMLQTDGGTVKMSISTNGEECSVQFVVLDKSGNSASSEIYRVRTKENGKRMWPGAVLPGIAAGCLIFRIRKMKLK